MRASVRASVRVHSALCLRRSVETRFGSFSLLLQLVPSLPCVLHSVMYELLSTLMTRRGRVHPFFLFSSCFFLGFGYVHRSSLSFNFDLSRKGHCGLSPTFSGRSTPLIKLQQAHFQAPTSYKKERKKKKSSSCPDGRIMTFHRI